MFVKICGITREDDALLAVAMGADAVGFIFAPSKRQIAPGIARDIARRLPPEILTVGVFRDEAPSRVIDVARSAGLRAVQLHGHETADDTRLVRSQIPFVIKALPAGSRDLARADEFGADVIMVDSPTPGSGRVFDWSLIEGVPDGVRLLLAGGLTPDNVASAIEVVKPWGVDAASGVEAARGEPGQKDARKVKNFIEAAKAAGELIDEVYAGAAASPLGAASLLDEPVPYDWSQDDRP